jgi:hypothetical protein
MPRYFPDGRIVSGMVNTNVAIDRKIVATQAGCAVPLDNSRIAYVRHVGDNKWKIFANDGVTETELDGQSATTLYASDGTWAAQLGDGFIRVNGQTPDVLKQAGLKGVGPGGVVAFCENFHVGLGLKLLANGKYTQIVPSVQACLDVQVLSPIHAVWTQGSKVRSNIPGLNILDGISGQGRTVVLDGVRYIAYYHRDGYGERVVLHPWNDPRGWVITAEGTGRWPAFRLDLLAKDGKLYLCWAKYQSENFIPAAGPVLDYGHYIQTAAIDPASPRSALARKPVVQVSKYGHKMWTGCFFSRNSRYGIDPSAPGEVEVIVDSGMKASGPVIIARVSDTAGDLIKEWAGRWNRVVAVYVAEEAKNNADAVNWAIDKARKRMDELKLPRRPIISYTGHSVWLNVKSDWFGIQCYVEHGQSIADAERGWRAVANLARGRKVVLVGCAYDRRSGAVDSPRLPESTIVEANIALDRLAREIKPVATLWFSWNRAGGAKEYPEVQSWIRAIDAVSTPPAIETISTPKPSPAPQPSPEEEDLKPKMNFDDSLAAMKEAAAIWREIHGKRDLELDEGQAHIWLWRLIVEGYTKEQILATVRAQAS